MGNRFSDKGNTVDESKVKAITQMVVPKVKNFLIDSLASFRMEVGLYHFSKLTALLGSIMKKLYIFGWEMHVSPSAISFTGLVFGLNFLKSDMSLLVS